MATITLQTVKRNKALQYADFLRKWSDELRDLGDVDMLREAEEIEQACDTIAECVSV